MSAKLTINIWPEFEIFLRTDANYSQSSTNRYATRSRFMQIAEFYEEYDLEWTKESFRKFLDYTENRPKQNKAVGTGDKIKKSYLNKFIGLGKWLDKYMSEKYQIPMILQDRKYNTEEQDIDYDWLTPEEIEKIAYKIIHYGKGGHYLNRRNRVMILIQGLIGPRPGEMCNLKWNDVRFDGISWYLIFRQTKTKKQRKCPIGKKLGEMLQDLPHWSEYVFTSYRGKKLREHEYNTEVKKRVEACKIKKNISAYDLRHSAATNMYLRGMPIEEIAEMLGHSNIQTTRRYIHIDLRRLHQALIVHPFLADERTNEMNRNILLDLIQKYFPNEHIERDENGGIIFRVP